MSEFFARNEKTTDIWLTPKYIVEALGPFDLDPCAPINAPYYHAPKIFTEIDDGLKQKWIGRVFMNPPYGSETKHWLKKLADYGNGIALVFARVETNMFFDHVWNKADSIFFFNKRISFYTIDEKQIGSPGAPSCLIAYGKENSMAIANSNLQGVQLPASLPYIKVTNNVL